MGGGPVGLMPSHRLAKLFQQLHLFPVAECLSLFDEPVVALRRLTPANQ